eukprot:IDg3864t1
MVLCRRWSAVSHVAFPHNLQRRFRGLYYDTVVKTCYTPSSWEYTTQRLRYSTSRTCPTSRHRDRCPPTGNQSSTKISTTWRRPASLMPHDSLQFTSILSACSIDFNSGGEKFVDSDGSSLANLGRSHPHELLF